MPWIPHVMVLDDDARVLESLVPDLALALGRAVARNPAIGAMLTRGEPSGPTPAAASVKVSTHGFTSERLAAHRHRSPHRLHLHLVRERGGRFDLARRLLNEQLFAVVVSDLRFSEDAGGLRAGQFFVEEIRRVHPAVEGLLYSAYPRPESFPPERFVRKGGDDTGLQDAIVAAIERHLADPSVNAFASALGDLGVVHQSDAFGTTLAQLFDLARLLGSDAPAARPPTRSRRPLPTLLIDGESGTGKRALAALFHAATDRRKAPLLVASCNELTNETLLRSILFGHKRGAFTDAREDRPGLVAASGRGVLLLDDFHRLPPACSAILHSFLEDGDYARLGEEEQRRQAEAIAVLTVETGPWQERRRSGELPPAFLARVERLPIHVSPLRDRPDDIEAQARVLTRAVASEVGVEMELSSDALEGLRAYPFAESNSRELRNLIERAIYRHKREVDVLAWKHLEAFTSGPEPPPATTTVPLAMPRAPASSEWHRRLRALASKILARGANLPPERAAELTETLFERSMPPLWSPTEAARTLPGLERPIPWPVWEDVWRCFSVSWLGGPAPAERVLGIPANTLRQWISDREAR